MKRFFTFLMAVWALLSISQTVKATKTYYVRGAFVEGQEWTKLDGKSMTDLGDERYSQEYKCTNTAQYRFRIAGGNLGYELCPNTKSYNLLDAKPSYGCFANNVSGYADNYFYVDMESGKTYTFTFDNSNVNNRTIACSVSGSSSSTETGAKFYLVGSMNNWGNVEATSKNYPFTTTDNVTYTCTLSGQDGLLYFKPKGFSADGTAFNDMLGPNGDTPITTYYQKVTYGGGAWTLVASSDKTYIITLDYSKPSEPQIKYSEQGSSGENPIANRKYSKGYYLVGNFFNFDGDNINYKDAVFKFQQQKDDEEGNAVYMVQIPATLTAKAQVMSVDATGTPVAVYGPGENSKTIDNTNPVMGEDHTATLVFDNLVKGKDISENGGNYWNMKSRRTEITEGGQDGSYTIYLTIDKLKKEPSLLTIKYDDMMRVAYYLSTDEKATAMTLNSVRKDVNGNFNAGKYQGTLYAQEGSEFYAISNAMRQIEHEEYIFDEYSGQVVNTGNILSTYPKLFLWGNGGKPLGETGNFIAATNGTFKLSNGVVGISSWEFNSNNGNNADNSKYGNTGGQVIQKSTNEIITSLSMVGPAIPGTTTDNKWDWASPVADMDFDVSENCYKLTIATTEENRNKVFRFVGNHTQKINWFENSNVDQLEMAAKYKDDGTYGIGHTASPSDPNEVSYTQDGLDKTDKSNEDNLDIIWNRPAGTWTVRFHIYTYSQDGNNPSYRYFYTISENRDLELRDFGDVVYKSETRNILNRGDYRYFRTWSDKTAWKRPKNVDVFVVSKVTPADDTHNVGFELTKINSFLSEDVIPANTGVILALKEGAEVPGAVFHKRKSLITYNTLVIPLEEATHKNLSYDGTNRLEKCVVAQNIPTADENNVNYLFGFYHAIHGLGLDNATYKQGYDQNDYLLGFWISNGKGLTYANSSYLPIKKEIAEKLNLGTSNDFSALQNQSGSAKKIPALFFDFGAVDNDVTGIQGVVESKTVLDGKYYTLSGQQVEHPTVGGIYIHNGKKYVIK